MIDAIHLRHFKCFEKLDLPLGELTLLTGMNAGGKSSVIQSLLLLKQSRSVMRERPHLCLNGIDVELGTVADVMDEQTARDSFSLGLSAGGCRIDVQCGIEDRDALVAPVLRILGTVDSGEPSELPGWPEEERAPWQQLSRLLHVSTERIGPRETYNADPGVNNDHWHLGPRGEFTAWLLHQHREMEVASALCRQEAPPLLLRQTEAWLGDFFPGAGIDVHRIDGTSLVTLRLRSSPRGNFHRPQNVGFGLTHILPILVGALATAEGATLVVENPETHLHPSAQAKIGRFLAKVAGTGRQVVVETHSDHVLNGVRIAVKEQQLPHDRVQIHYFNRRPNVAAAEPAHVTTPQLLEGGRIDRWPTGFFDQLEQDLETLTSWD